MKTETTPPTRSTAQRIAEKICDECGVGKFDTHWRTKMTGIANQELAREREQVRDLLCECLAKIEDAQKAISYAASAPFNKSSIPDDPIVIKLRTALAQLEAP